MDSAGGWRARQVSSAQSKDVYDSIRLNTIDVDTGAMEARVTEARMGALATMAANIADTYDAVRHSLRVTQTP